jgi:hypothetical protein
MSSSEVTMEAMSVRFHLGNEGLKSGKEVTPGQSCSLGVPRMLRVVSRRYGEVQAHACVH